MLRGEFHRGDGLVIPNNLMTYGIGILFQAALTNGGYDFHLGLANCNPDPELAIEDLNEPTIGVNGYARQPITRDSDGWAVQGEFNGEKYYETRLFVFEADGGDFDMPVTRPVIINSLDALSGQLVVALGMPIPEFVITPETPEEERTFKYRIYGR